jgi:hypothetical protein
LDRIPITVGGTDITGVDFGYVRDPETGSIGYTVWLDADRDGVQDASENGIGGVLVTLYGAGPDGQIGGADDVLLGTATTDPAGHYTFPNLPAGNYYVAIDHGSLPGGGAGLDETSGGNDDLSGLVNLSEGEKYDDADLGYAPEPGTSAIGDRVWYDTDMDGVQDPGEIGVGGVTITVSGPGCDDCVVPACRLLGHERRRHADIPDAGHAGPGHPLRGLRPGVLRLHRQPGRPRLAGQQR